MQYAESWAWDTVAAWAELCTRVQLMSIHYEQSLYTLGGLYALRGNENFLEDTAIAVMLTKGNPKLARAWRVVKACEKKRSMPLHAMEMRLLEAYKDIRKAAREYKTWGRQSDFVW